MLDNGSDSWDWSSALLLDATNLPGFAPSSSFGVTGLASVSSLFCRLRSAVRGMISLAGVFLRVLGIIALSERRFVYLGVISWTLLGTRQSVSIFSLKKNTHVFT